MSIKNILIEKMVEKGLSESSIKNYIRNLELLNNGDELKSLSFLKKKDEIINKLSDKKPNTKRSYLIAIVSALSVLDDKKNAKLYDFYYNQMMEMNKTLKEVEKSNEKSDAQKENWIEKDEIDNKLNDLVKSVEEFPKSVNEKQYNTVLQMIILSLYVLQSPRRNADYQFMNVVKDKVPDDKINFLVYDKKQFWFRKYKTAKSELKDKNELIVDINDKLFKNIELYFKYHPLIKGKKINAKDEIAFLVNYQGEPLLNVNSITLIINRIFGKKIGSSMLRHLYVSHKYGDILQEMKEDSKDMSHSLEMQKDYIKN